MTPLITAAKETSKRLASVSLRKCARYFFSRNFSRSETARLLLKIILESFKLHYFFLTSNTCYEYFDVRTQIRSDAWFDCKYNETYDTILELEKIGGREGHYKKGKGSPAM